MEREHGKRDIEREVRKATKKQQGFRDFFKARLQKKSRVGAGDKKVWIFFSRQAETLLLFLLSTYLRWEDRRMDKGLQGGR